VKDEPRQVWDKYYQSLSSDMPQSAAASEAMSRVDRSGTLLSLDIVGYEANFAYRTMNEEEKVLNCFEKSVNL
jgi:DNA/RNA-binding domain of Phe-tRNA-synthetase-like protein